MRKHCIRAICIFGVLVVLFSCCSLSAFAVDPVSASVIANSFAQAIAAYGASNGVAMTFDVGSTDGIGETVHELWSDFRAGTQDADDYDTLAAALFPNLYYKALSAAGTAAEAYTVGVSITSEYAEEFDSFYNWLLSGPAEMVQVDNQYYQFSQAQIGANGVPIQVGYIDPGIVSSLPIVNLSSSDSSLYNSSLKVCRTSYNPNPSSKTTYGLVSNMSDVYAFLYTSDSVVYNACILSTNSSFTRDHSKYAYYYTNGNGYGANVLGGSVFYSSGLYYVYGGIAGDSYRTTETFIPVYSSLSAGLSAASSYLADPSAGADTVGVKAYSPSGIADIPDTADPNYDALNRAKDIPLNIPWDDSLFGDGTDALTGEEAGAIAGEVSGVLVDDKVIPLVEEAEAVNPRPDPDDDPSGDPDDYAVLGLEDVFPFCIPFDIYAFLSALAADPVPPSFTCTFDFPEALGGTQTLELDFDTPTFNQLAQLLRLLELLAFIVGLALLTRSMFIRG